MVCVKQAQIIRAQNSARDTTIQSVIKKCPLDVTDLHKLEYVFQTQNCFKVKLRLMECCLNENCDLRSNKF